MRTAEILRRFPGLTRDHLLYWRRKGYIKARRIKLDRREVMDYPQEQVEKIRLMWDLVQKGVSAQEASIRVDFQLKMDEKDIKKLTERVTDSILAHREEVSGRDTGSPHLYHSDVKKTSDGGYVVKFWSKGGWFHDCWITAKISKDGLVTFNHCGCKGMNDLVRMVRKDIE